MFSYLFRQQSIFGTSTRGATKEELQMMPYLERVIKESMRLYTVVPIIARNVEKDTYLRKYSLKCKYAYNTHNCSANTADTTGHILKKHLRNVRISMLLVPAR